MRRYVILASLLAIICSISHAEQMVEIAVEVAEVNNDKAREIGVDWVNEIAAVDTSAGVGTQGGGLPSILASGEWKRTSQYTADLKIMVEKGAARIMSKPKLLTKSGSSAKFLIGGEIPVVSAGVGGGEIEWKEYGIKLNVKPVIKDNKEIDIDVRTEVSRLDWENAIGSLPALASRIANSEVVLKNEETITIAGLVETKKEELKTGVPYLMDIPVIGMLFSRSAVQDIETTVMIFVTPRIIK